MYSLGSRKKDSWLSWFLKGVLFLLFLILFGKLIDIQIIKGSYYRNLSEQNRIRRIPIPAPRGKIVSTDGIVLADNVAIKKRLVTEGNTVSLSLDLTNAKPEEIVTDYKRIYPLGEKFAHASGYLGVVNEKEVGTVDPYCPLKGIRPSGSLVGVSGLEEYYDCELRGSDGEQLVEVNTLGDSVRILGIKNPTPGSDLTTSINAGLQEEISKYFKMPDMVNGKTVYTNKHGAAVVTGIDGRIMAFYSEPSFDPNLLIGNIEGVSENSATLSALFKSPDLPFFNRVIGGTFHPGSVFKPLVALAALEEGAINKAYRYVDSGHVTVNGFTYNNWYFTEYGRTEGEIDLTRALARSTDTFFYKIGELTGPDNIAKWADYFNLDKKTNIDLPGEVKGLIPSPEWKKKTKKEQWFLGNTYNTSIGQGDVAVTPLQINTSIAAIAANGKVCQPLFNKNLPTVCRQVSVNQKNVDLVKEGMLKACETGGTAYTFFDFPEKNNSVKVACKTGTAQVDADGTPHAWFTFFAPADKPEIVVTVLVEKGGQGSSIAGPIARRIADYYFSAR